MKRKKNGFMLLIILIALTSIALLIPLLLNSLDSANERVLNADRWNKIKWAVAGHQLGFYDYKKKNNIVSPVYADYIATCSYGDFHIVSEIKEFSTNDKNNYGYLLKPALYQGSPGHYKKIDYDLSFFNQETWVYPNVYANGNSSSVLFPDGTLHAFGENTNGQLGIGNQYSVSSPKKLSKYASGESLNPIWMVSYGSDNSSLMDLEGNYCEVGGIEPFVKFDEPKKVNLPFKPISTACGDRFYAVLGLDGKVYRKSTNKKFCSTDIVSYTEIPGCSNVKTIYAGRNNLFAIDENGDLYGCGNNASFSMGVVDVASLTDGVADNFVKIENNINLTNIVSCDVSGNEIAYAPTVTPTLNVVSEYDTSFLTIYVSKPLEYEINNIDETEYWVDYYISLKNKDDDSEISFYEYDIEKLSEKVFAIRFLCKKIPIGNYWIELKRYVATKNNWVRIRNSNRYGNDELATAKTFFCSPIPGAISLELPSKLWVSKSKGSDCLFKFDAVDKSTNNFVFKSVASGNGFTYFIAYDKLEKKNKLFALGVNDYGQLGLGVEYNTSVVNMIPINLLVGNAGFSTDSTEEPICIGAGDSHALVLSNKGYTYSTGKNDFGQQGRKADLINCTSLRRITKNLPSNIKSNYIVSIAVGLNHSIAIDKKGNVYTWGNNSKGQLGRSTASGKDITTKTISF